MTTKAAIDMQASPGLKFDYFPVRKNAFLRYAIAPSAMPPVKGTVLLLQDRGDYIEMHADIIKTLNQRGFTVATFDWFGQGGSSREKGDQRGGHISDFRDCLNDLDELFHAVFLPDLPAPFYVMASGMGAILALAAHNILQSQIRRMILAAPLFQPKGRKPGGLYHAYARFMSDLGFSVLGTSSSLSERPREQNPIAIARKARDKDNIQDIGHPTLGWYTTMLDAANHILSLQQNDTMVIPTLFIISNKDAISDPKVTRQLADRLRMADSITLIGASHDFMLYNARHKNQFWHAFDAFIPGTGAPTPGRLLDDSIII